MKPFSHSIRVSYDGKAVQQGANRNANDLRRLNDAASRGNVIAGRTISQNRILATTYSRVALAVSAALTSFGSVGFTRHVAESERLTIRLKNLAGTTERYQEIQAYLAESADRLNIRYRTLSDSYTRLLVLEKQNTVSAIESRQILEGLTDTAKQLGASNEQVERSMYGMTQALTQGTVQTTELLQTTESMPGLLQAMDKAAGMAAGGFKRLVGEGKVTSQFFKETLIKAFEEFEGGARAMEGSISGSVSDFLTIYDNLLIKLEQPVNAAVVPVIEAATFALTHLKDNTEILGTMADGAVFLATVLAGRLAGSLATSTAGFIGNAIASRKKYLADLASAKSALDLARAEHAAAVGMNNSAAAGRTKSVTSLQAAASVRVLTSATNTYNAAVTAASVKTRAMAFTMSALGGPVGIITAAGLALAYFTSQSDNAELSSDELRSSLNELTSGFDKLTLAQQKARNERISDSLDDYRDRVSQTQAELDKLRAKLEKPMRLRGDPSGAKAREKRAEINKQIIFQEELLERHLAAQKELQEAQVRLKAQIANGGKSEDDNKPSEVKDPYADIDYEKELARLDKELQTRRERVQTAFENRKKIVEAALAKEYITKESAAERIKKLKKAKEAELTSISREEQKNRDDAANAARQKELDDIEKDYEERLRLLRGFASRKEQIEHDLRERLAQARRDDEILRAQGFASEAERNEHAHQERLLDIKFQGNSQMRGIVFSRAEWERKTELEKTKSVIDIGEAGFKAFAGQSKKAAALYKAFAITKAVINTYEMATGAYNALASIPYVGPALGAAAAAAAIGFGLAQVNQIKSTDYSSVNHGGIDYVPHEQTSRIQKGERIVSPKQNVQLTKAVNKINQGEGGGQVAVQVSYAPKFDVTGTDDSSMSKLEALEKEMQQRFFNNLAAQLNGRTGVVYKSVRRAAA